MKSEPTFVKSSEKLLQQLKENQKVDSIQYNVIEDLERSVDSAHEAINFVKHKDI